MLYYNQQYFLSSDHKFRIIFIITSSLTVLSVFNRLTELFSGHVTDQVITRKKCHFIWEWKTETSEGMFVQKQMWFFSCFLGIFARSCWLRNCIWKKYLTASFYRGATEPRLQFQRHRLKSSQQGLFSTHHQRFIKLLQNLSPPPQ